MSDNYQVKHYSLIPLSFKKRRKNGPYLKLIVSSYRSVENNYSWHFMPILNYNTYDENNKYGEIGQEINQFNANIIRRTVSRRNYLKSIVPKICELILNNKMNIEWLVKIIISFFGCGIDEQLFMRNYELLIIDRNNCRYLW